MKPLVVAFGALFVVLSCGCSPVTYQTREIPYQQLPTQPLPDGATYALIVPSTSVGAADLLAGLRIHGLTKAANPATAEVTIEAHVAHALISDLHVESGPAPVVAGTGGPSNGGPGNSGPGNSGSASAGPGGYTPYRYCGTISVPSFLNISSQQHGVLIARDRAVDTRFTFDSEPRSQQPFSSPVALEISFAQQREHLLHKAANSEVRRLLAQANALLADAYTTRATTVTLPLAVAHKTDARFAQAEVAFSQAMVGKVSDAAGRAARLQPVIEQWRQISDHPLGEDDEDRSRSAGAALYDEAVGLFLLGQLDDAERTVIAAQGKGVDAGTTAQLTGAIQDRRSREAAQTAQP